MSAPTETRRTHFTVLPLAHKTHRCARCGYDLREGQQAVAVRQPSAVHFEHDGECPAREVDRHPFLR